MKPYIFHTTTADYENLPRFQYQSAQTNYVPLLPQVRAVPIGEGSIENLDKSAKAFLEFVKQFHDCLF